MTPAPRSRRTGGPGWSLVQDCPRCGHSEDRCRCSAPAPAPAPEGTPIIRLRLEKRAGKPVTVLAAEGLSKEHLAALLKHLKALCGTGGTVKEARAELQGDHRDRLRPLLADKGYRVKG